MKIVNKSYDAKQVRTGDHIQANFKIINTGKINLCSEEVITSCGCTGYKIFENNVPPKEEINLAVEVDTSHKK